MAKLLIKKGTKQVIIVHKSAKSNTRHFPIPDNRNGNRTTTLSSPEITQCTLVKIVEVDILSKD